MPNIFIYNHAQHFVSQHSHKHFGYHSVFPLHRWVSNCISILTPDMKSTASRTGASIVVCAEPRRISRKRGCVESTDAEVASSLHLNLTPHCLYSLTYPATAAQLFLSLCVSSEMSIISQRLPAIQFSGGNYHSEGILREKNAAH